MKKIIIAIILLVVIGGAIGLGLYLSKDKSDALKFKEEYEAINDLPIETNNNTYKVLNLPKDNPIVYSNYNEIYELLEKGTGVIYFGFPECPWCRTAIPILLEAAADTGTTKIYYMNNLEDRDIKKIVDGKIVEEKKATNEYNKLLQLLGEYSSEYKDLKNPEIRRIYFPTVVFIKDGDILGTIVGTIDSHIDPYISLTKEERNELKVMYIDYMTELLICEKSC